MYTCCREVEVLRDAASEARAGVDEDEEVYCLLLHIDLINGKFFDFVPGSK